jgi:hypothetical protein|tara:strand:- start:18277 stop:18459 length:183 start_codon:yes stop_codon:yes gene_type:complete
MDEDLKDLTAMIVYDETSKSLIISVTGFRNNFHGKEVSNWICNSLNIDIEEISGSGPTVH